MKRIDVAKPKFTREIFNPYIGRRRIRRGPKSRYRRRRFQFCRTGYSSLRLPGTIGSTAFNAAYYVALICQEPISPARSDHALAIQISIYANLLMLTSCFIRLNRATRDRYQYLIEDFCLRVAGKPVLLPRHGKTAAFIFRNRSSAYLERRISGLRGLLIQATKAASLPISEIKPVGLRQWANANSEARRDAKRHKSAVRAGNRVLKDLMRKTYVEDSRHLLVQRPALLLVPPRSIA